MFNYQSLSKDVGEVLKEVLTAVGTIVSIPLTLPGVRPVTKTVIKGGMYLSGVMQRYYQQLEGELNLIFEEAKTEVKGQTGIKDSATQEKPDDYREEVSVKDKDYSSWNYDDLYELAQEWDIKGRSNMNKEELIREIRKAE